MTSFVVREPLDLIALVPVVVGFHPETSLVLLSFGGSAGGFHARVDIPSGAAERTELAGLLAEAAVANHATTAAVLAYTDDRELADLGIEAVARALTDAGIQVIERLRVEGGRFFSSRGPAGGTAYDLSSHPLIAERVVEGQVLHASRAELAATLQPDLSDPGGVSAVDAEAARLPVLVCSDSDRSSGRADGAAALAREARWIQRRVRRYVRTRRRLTSADAARMALAVSVVELRDVAWSAMTREDARVHVELWRDLGRRTPTRLLAPVASLLAFAAWLAGDGALAWCALDRVAEVDPEYSLAELVAEVLQRAVPPTVWTPPPMERLPVLTHDPGLRAC